MEKKRTTNHTKKEQSVQSMPQHFVNYKRNVHFLLIVCTRLTFTIQRLVKGSEISTRGRIDIYIYMFRLKIIMRSQHLPRFFP